MRAMMLPFPFGEADKDDEPVPMPPVEIACLTLSEVAETYQRPCPFKVGDLVTPRRGYWVRGDGEPHVVIEVFEKPIRFFPNDAESDVVGSLTYGARIDMRVACMSNHKRHIVAFCAESWAYEPFTIKNGAA